MQAMLAAARPVLDASLIAELQAIGLDPQRTLLPAYSVEVARRAVTICAARLNPSMQTEAALEAFGRRFVERYTETLIGRALLVAGKMLGPKRLLERLAKQLRTANNYQETKVTHLEAGHSELWCNEVMHGPWYAGIIAQTLINVGAKDATVTVTRNDEQGAIFDVRWKE